MKILFIIPNTVLGGAERQAFLLAKYLRLLYELDVKFICFGKNEGAFTILLQKNSIEYTILKNPKGKNILKRIIFAFKFIKVERQTAPDVIMPYTHTANHYVGLFRVLLKAKLFIWNQRDGGLGTRSTIFSRIAISNFDKFIANSNTGYDFLRQELNVPEEKIKIIYNGIELNPPAASRDKWRETKGFRSDAILVIMPANLTENKDHETLLYAWPEVCKCYNNSYLLLAGRGENGRKDYLEKLAKDLGITETVKFMGMVEDISSALHAADLSVLSSRSEGLSNAVLESMAAGLPVIGTNIPSIKFLLEKEECLFDAGNPEELASRIINLLNSYDKRKDIGSYNKEKVTAMFSPKKMAEAFFREMKI